MIETEVTGVIEETEESAGARARLITAHEAARAANTKRTPTPPAAITVPVSAKIATPADGMIVNGTVAIGEIVVNVETGVDATSMIDPDETCLRTDHDVEAIGTVVIAVVVAAVMAAAAVVVVVVTEETRRNAALHLRGRRNLLRI